MIQVRSEDLFSNTGWFESAKFPRKAANLANLPIVRFYSLRFAFLTIFTFHIFSRPIRNSVRHYEPYIKVTSNKPTIFLSYLPRPSTYYRYEILRKRS